MIIMIIDCNGKINIFNLFVNLCKFLSKNGATIYTHNTPPRPKNSEHSKQIRPFIFKNTPV